MDASTTNTGQLVGKPVDGISTSIVDRISTNSNNNNSNGQSNVQSRIPRPTFSGVGGTASNTLPVADRSRPRVNVRRPTVMPASIPVRAPTSAESTADYVRSVLATLDSHTDAGSSSSNDATTSSTIGNRRRTVLPLLNKGTGSGSTSLFTATTGSPVSAIPELTAPSTPPPSNRGNNDSNEKVYSNLNSKAISSSGIHHSDTISTNAIGDGGSKTTVINSEDSMPTPILPPKYSTPTHMNGHSDSNRSGSSRDVDSDNSLVGYSMGNTPGLDSLLGSPFKNSRVPDGADVANAFEEDGYSATNSSGGGRGSSSTKSLGLGSNIGSHPVPTTPIVMTTLNEGDMKKEILSMNPNKNTLSSNTRGVSVIGTTTPSITSLQADGVQGRRGSSVTEAVVALGHTPASMSYAPLDVLLHGSGNTNHSHSSGKSNIGSGSSSGRLSQAGIDSGRIEITTEEYDELKSKNSSLEGSVYTMRKLLEEMEKQSTIQKDQLQEVSVERDTLKRKIINMEVEANEQSAELEYKEQQKKIKDTAISSLERDLITAHARNKQLNDDIKFLVDKTAEMEKKTAVAVNTQSNLMDDGKPVVTVEDVSRELGGREKEQVGNIIVDNYSE